MNFHLCTLVERPPQRASTMIMSFSSSAAVWPSTERMAVCKFTLINFVAIRSAKWAVKQQQQLKIYCHGQANRLVDWWSAADKQGYHWPTDGCPRPARHVTTVASFPTANCWNTLAATFVQLCVKQAARVHHCWPDVHTDQHVTARDSH